MSDSDNEIQRLQALVDQTPPEDPSYAPLLRNLGARYSIRYSETNDLSDLDRTNEYLQASIDRTPSDDPYYISLLENLGAGHHIRHSRTNTSSDLNKIIECFQALVDQTPLEHPKRVARVCSLAASYGLRHRRTDSTSDLDRAIEYLQVSVDQTSPDDPYYVGLLQSLGAGYNDRFRIKGNVNDLNESPKYLQISFDRYPQDQQEERAARLQCLGIGYNDSFSRTGNIDALTKAIECLQASVDQTPLNRPEHAARLEDLGNAYSNHHSRTGEIRSLDIAITHSQASVEQTQSDHPDRTRRLANLGAKYYKRHRWTGNTTDLDTALRYSEESLKHTLLSDLARASRLYDCGAVYAVRFSRTGNISDIKTAIEYLRESLGHTPLDHPARAGRVRDLGAAYNDRHSRTDNPSDLDTAIQYFQESLDHTPPDHPERAGSLQGLGIGYQKKHHISDKTSDLDMAIQYFQASLDLTPKDDPARADRLRDLGVGYVDRHRRTEDTSDLDMAVEWLEEATGSLAFTVRDRLLAAMKLLPIYTETGRWEEAYSVAYKAMQLVSLLTPRFLNNADKQDLLTMVAGLASDSAAIAFSAAKDVFNAVQFLELGRGVISGSLTEMRTDTTALSNSDPDLGQEFIRLRDLLDSPKASVDDKIPTSWSNPSDPRYNAQNRIEVLLSEIRNKQGFEDFLLAPNQDNMQNAATLGAIVVVNVSQYRCDAILVEQHTIRLVPLTRLSSKDIERKAQDLEFGSSETLGWMWDTIASPVLEALGLTNTPSDGQWPRMWWIPTGLLTKFPLHAAGHHKGGHSATVLDRVMSSYSLSIKAIIHRRAVRPSEALRAAPSQALLVGVPNAPGSQPLPNVEGEVEIVREVCESMAITLIKSGHQKSDILPHLVQCQIFHFAGHGYTSPNDPSKSFLVLEGSSNPLTVADLLEISVRDHSPFLAYLSACGTGQMRDERLLDESIHLVSAFQLAGFRHVIGTLWDVRDETCVDVAEITYKGIRDGCMTDASVCLGLHDASRKLRDKWLPASAGSKVRRRAQVRDASHSGDGRVQSDRDIVVYDLDEETEERSLSWVPYVHYGV